MWDFMQQDDFIIMWEFKNVILICDKNCNSSTASRISTTQCLSDTLHDDAFPHIVQLHKVLYSLF